MAGSKETLPYYLKVHRLIKEMKPEFKIVGNPGQPVVDEGMMKTVDCLVLFERQHRRLCRVQDLTGVIALVGPLPGEPFREHRAHGRDAGRPSAGPGKGQGSKAEPAVHHEPSDAQPI